ncbi:MAG: hypothetical protein QOK28_2916 [Actinomycetota bacterium]|jgi:hypothetical protein
MTKRIYSEQALCLDYEGVHLRIPDDKVWMVLLQPVKQGEPIRYMEFSPMSKRPIVDCDDRKIYKQ